MGGREKGAGELSLPLQCAVRVFVCVHMWHICEKGGRGDITVLSYQHCYFVETKLMLMSSFVLQFWYLALVRVSRQQLFVVVSVLRSATLQSTMEFLRCYLARYTLLWLSLEPEV